MDQPTLTNWVSDFKQATSEEEKQAYLRKIETEIKAETYEQAMEGIQVLRERVVELREQILAEKPTPVN